MLRALFGDSTSSTAARLLAAMRDGDAGALDRELQRAAQVCREPAGDSGAAERSELLAAVVEELREAAGREGTNGVAWEANTQLLAHLAGLG